MTKLQKILFSVVAILTLVMMTICFSFYKAIYIEPDEIKINYQLIKNNKIPTQMYDVSIAYLTDLEYGPFENKERTDVLFAQLNALHPDVLVFGGDLFASDFEISEEAKQQMIDRLNSVDAPLGKFAVLGEQDLISEDRLNLVNDIYHQSQIEVLNNTHRMIGNYSASGIELIGLNPEANYESALSGVGENTYNLLVSHYADPFCSDYLKHASISLAIAGNSHGTQIMFPLFGGYRLWPGNETLNRADGQNLPFPYLISSGTGCIKVNARLNSTPEIIYFIFSG